MKKEDQTIMVVDKNKLFQDNYFQGFQPMGNVNFESRILKDHTFMRRGDVEENPNYKQPIAYFTIINPLAKTVFGYQRSTKAGEVRLHKKWSVGLGGHIEKFDKGVDGSLEKNPIYTSMLRELEEEVHIGDLNNLKPKLLGYINDDSDAVGQVHFGLLYTFEVNSGVIVKPKDEEISSGDMIAFELLKTFSGENNLGYKMEEWSKIAMEPIEKYLDLSLNI
ncbi:hypothetical protein CL617_02905 [archaeon]|nr:hypothetical protein [archaeon]|tara:strand:- start:737 stop:1399 length:663 start_codon:yes stop_codon:yes gene_type:complete